MISRKIIFLDSSKATEVDLTRGYAKFEYPQPIEPFGSSCKIAVTSFSYTNFFINITAPNNVIYYSDNPVLPQKYTITIPTGSYSLDDLNDFIQSTILAQTTLSIWSLKPNYSTGKVIISFGNVTGWFVNLEATAPAILGFGVQHVPVTDSNTVYYSEEAPNQASFNSITQIKVTSDLATDSIDNSNLSSNVILLSTPIANIGSVQKDEPHNLLTIESNRLTTKCSSITIQILDQLDRPVYFYEHFTLVILVI